MPKRLAAPALQRLRVRKPGGTSFLSKACRKCSWGLPLQARGKEQGRFEARRTQLHAHDWVVYAKQPLGGPEQVLAYLGRYPHRLKGGEFIRRFLLHVLPLGFKRIRHYGLLAPAHKRKRLAQARAALQHPEPDPVMVESVAQFMLRIARFDIQRCPCCGHVGLRLTPLPPSRPASLPLTRGPP